MKNDIEIKLNFKESLKEIDNVKQRLNNLKRIMDEMGISDYLKWKNNKLQKLKSKNRKAAKIIAKQKKQLQMLHEDRNIRIIKELETRNPLFATPDPMGQVFMISSWDDVEDPLKDIALMVEAIKPDSDRIDSMKRAMENYPTIGGYCKCNEDKEIDNQDFHVVDLCGCSLPSKTELKKMLIEIYEEGGTKPSKVCFKNVRGP